MTDPHAMHDMTASHADHAHHDPMAADSSGHGGHAGHGAQHVAQFRRLFWINLLLAVPVVAFSGMFAMLIGYPLPEFPGVDLIPPALGTVMYVWGGARSSSARSESFARVHQG